MSETNCCTGPKHIKGSKERYIHQDKTKPANVWGNPLCHATKLHYKTLAVILVSNGCTPVRQSQSAYLATWLMTGAKLVGPYS